MKSVDSKYIKEVIFNDADSLLKAINYGGELYKALSGGFIYRGHFSDKYKLVPAALRGGGLDPFHPSRYNEDDKLKLVSELEITQIWGEYQLLQQFYNNCDRNNLRVPDCVRLRDSVVKSYDLVSLFKREEWLPRELWEVAALAQHYGVPTRLLDWTSNIHTALYFSVADYVKPLSLSEHLARNENRLLHSGKIDEDHCEVWALDTKIIIGKENTLPLKLIRPPYNGNPNLAAQEGIFTLWSVMKPVQTKGKIKIEQELCNKEPLDSLLVKKFEELEMEERPYLYRLSFPHKAAVEIFQYLERLGHTAARLFPGYAGVVQAMKEGAQFNDR